MKKKLLKIAPIGIILMAGIIIAIVIMIGGASKSSYIETKMGSTNIFENSLELMENQEILSSYTGTDKGIFSILWYNNLVVYNDFETNTYTPLCNKPNCTHDDKDCNAYYESCEYVFFYKGKIYIAGVNSIICADFDGSNKREIVNLLDTSLDNKGIDCLAWMSTPIFDGNSIYFTTTTQSKENGNSGDDKYQTQTDEKKTTDKVIKFNLDTEEFTTVYTFGAYYQTNSEILCIDEDYIYIKHQEQDYPLQEEYDNPDIVKTDKERLDIYKIDKNSGEDEIILNYENMGITKCVNNKLYFTKHQYNYDKGIEDSGYVTVENKLYAYDLSTKETSVILTDDLLSKSGEKFRYVITDDEIIFNNDFDKKLTIYDLDGNLKKEIDNPGFFITEAYNSAYFVNRVSMWSKSLSFVKKSDIDRKEIPIYPVGIPQEKTN